MFKIPLLRNLFLAMLLVALALPAYIHFRILPAFNAQLVANTEEEAQRVAAHLAGMLPRDLPVITHEAIVGTPSLAHTLRQGVGELGLWKLRLFDAQGLLVFSTQPEEVGRRNEEVYFREVVAKGRAWSKMVEKGGRSAEGEPVTLNIVETYIPIMRGAGFQGAFEVYYDVTRRTERQVELLRQAGVAMLLILGGLLAFLLLALRRAGRAFEESRRATDTIQALGRQREQLINALGEGVYGVDKQGRATFINPAALRMLGFTREAVLGADQHLLFHHHHPDGSPYAHADCPIRQTLNDGQERSVEADVFWRADGGAFPVEYVASPILAEDGDQAGAVVVFRDVTARREAEAALRAARAAAEYASRAKSQFLANMSHEIRTPLNAVIGMTALLEETPLDETQRDFVRTIQTSGEALLVLINDILDYSKIEAGHLELEDHPFDLLDCLDTSLDLIALRAGEKGIELIHDFNPDLPRTLVGDITRLRQILVNLLTNAVKFTEHGQVVLSARLLEGEPGPDLEQPRPVLLRLSVKDSGLGIPPDKQDRLFKSFSQVDASTTRKFGGTGLGLAISRRLAELMGGEMWVESSGIPGEGATFHFTLRCRAAQQAVDAWQRENLPRLAGKRVLVVDDNATNLEILRRVLEVFGIQPLLYSDPRAALAAARAGLGHDLAILDLQMPGLDGIGLARALDALPAPRPRLLLSSLGRPLAEEEARLFRSALTKPVKFGVLFDALVKALEAPAPRPAESVAPAAVEEKALRILLVEDNPVNQKVATHLLAKLGYRADLAGNGIEALEALERRSYDVVLMDVQMPEMDGLEASRRIVAQWPERRPRIVAMTANAMQGDREECLAAGMDDYIAKPIRIEQLRDALAHAAD